MVMVLVMVMIQGVKAIIVCLLWPVVQSPGLGAPGNVVCGKSMAQAECIANLDHSIKLWARMGNDIGANATIHKKVALNSVPPIIRLLPAYSHQHLNTFQFKFGQAQGGGSACCR